MRSFSKKLAAALAVAAMVVTMVPAASAKAADDFSLNRTAQTLYVNKGVNDKGSDKLAEGLYGNVQTYDFNLKNKPTDWKTAYSYKWATSDAKVATVVASGVTTAVGVGNATITCTVTEKATGNVAATLAAKVTVKANADKVEVVAADGEEYDGTTVVAGQTIDLNRTMYDANGNKTNKRGQVVTDYTRWIVEPADKGVTVNQANGVYTFGELTADEYTLYCETYQSDKYDQATAVSNKIVVTANVANEFEIKQDTLTKFTVNFNSAVKSLGDVTITRLYNNGSYSFEFPVVVKEAKLAADGKSATVEVYTNFADKTDYVVTIDGFDAYTMTASAGVPASMTISSSATAVSPFVTAATETSLSYKLYDANGVDVTTGTETVLFNAKEYSTDGSYYVASNVIWFAKAGLSTVVTAEYQSGRVENGIQVGNVSAEMAFVSVEATPVTLKSISGTLLNASGEDMKALDVPMGDTAFLQVKAALSTGDPFVITTGQSVANVGTISFEETTPNVLALDKSTMQLYMFNTGVARVIVNATNTVNGTTTTVPVGSITINVKTARTLNSVSVDKSLVTVGTVDGFDTADVKFTAKDQYGKDYPISSVVVEGTTDAANAVKAAITVAADNSKVTIDGSAMATALGTSNAVQLTYKVKINNSKEVSFSVLVKKASDNANTNYVSIEASSAFGDVARTVDSKNAKSITFTVYTMNNGVKVGYTPVAAYPSDVATATPGNYYFKVTKNGTDITGSVVATGSAVTVNFSGTEEITNGAVTGSAVTYSLGAGNYAFTLYKCVASGSTNVLVQQQTATGTATCNTGSYGAAVRVAETVAAADQASVRACFKVNNTKGNEATAPYYVDMDTSSTDYVYVKSITFYDEVGDNVYAPYKVNVGVALKKAN